MTGIQEILIMLPLERYGVGEAKTVQHLIKEAETGESILFIENGVPIRLIEIISIQVYNRDQTRKLIEVKQVFADKRVRERNLEGITEKLLPGESRDIKAAILRALAEELGLSAQQIKSVTGGRYTTMEEQESPSYPGLKTRYVKRKAMVATTLQGDEELKEVQPDKTTYFGWKPAKRFGAG